MKKIILSITIIIALGFSQFGHAQFFLGKKKAQLSGITFSIKGTGDIYADLSHEGLYSMLKPNERNNFNIKNYERAGSYNASMIGGRMGLDFSFNPKNKAGEIKFNREIRVSASLGFDKEIAIDVVPIGAVNAWENSITLCVVENDLTFDMMYLFKTPFLEVFELYAGPGANVGGTFGNRFIFMNETPSDQPEYKARNSSYLRTCAVAGGAINAKFITFKLEALYGVGAQIVHNGDANFHQTFGMNISAGVRLNYKKK